MKQWMCHHTCVNVVGHSLHMICCDVVPAVICITMHLLRRNWHPEWLSLMSAALTAVNKEWRPPPRQFVEKEDTL